MAFRPGDGRIFDVAAEKSFPLLELYYIVRDGKLYFSSLPHGPFHPVGEKGSEAVLRHERVVGVRLIER